MLLGIQQRGCQAIFRKRDAFPHIDGRGAIVDAVCQYRHEQLRRDREPLFYQALPRL